MCCVVMVFCLLSFFFFKQKTAYEMRISDWSSDVCSSDLTVVVAQRVRSGFGDLHRQDRSLLRSPAGQRTANAGTRIGRASCRESVSVRVDLGGRRIIKKKKNTKSVMYKNMTER